MNLLLFSQPDRRERDTIEIRDRRLQHLLKVHGAAAGDAVRVGEIEGRMGSGKILAIDSERALITVALQKAPPQKLPLIIILALPRPKMLRRILRNIAEMGVAQLHLINTYRVEKSYWQTPVLQTATIRDYLLRGLEQSRDTCLPTVTCHPRFKPFVEDQLPEITAGSRALLAHPGDHAPCPRDLSEPTVLVIGPEGGFIPYEVDKLEAAGCEPVALGPRILRVENAVSYLLGRLSSH